MLNIFTIKIYNQITAVKHLKGFNQRATNIDYQSKKREKMRILSSKGIPLPPHFLQLGSEVKLISDRKGSPNVNKPILRFIP